MKIVGLVPMRKGSERLPGKHLLDVGGFTPALRVVNALLGVTHIGAVYVATNDPKVRTCLSVKPVRFFQRSEVSASSLAAVNLLLLEFCRDVSCDIIVMVQATNMSVTSRHIYRALLLFESSRADWLVSGVTMRRYLYHKGDRSTIDPFEETARRLGLASLRKVFIENGAIYVFKRKEFLRTGELVTGKVVGYEMEAESIFELDTPKDLDIVRRLHAQPK